MYISSNGKFQSDKWLLTINNPLENGLTHGIIKDRLAEFPSCAYFAMSDEVGENGTPHIHVFSIFSKTVAFGVIKSLFPTAHLDIVRGTNSEVRNYVFKQGQKWQKSSKAETNIIESHYEWGNMPTDSLSERLEYIQQLVREGYSDDEILSGEVPLLDDIETQIEPNTAEIKTPRQLHCYFVEGPVGVDKTDFILTEHGDNVFIATNVINPLNGYANEDVVVFEGLNAIFLAPWIENYFEVDSKFFTAEKNRSLVYTKAYVTSDMPFFKAFLFECRKKSRIFSPCGLFCNIHTVVSVKADGTREQFSIDDYVKLYF
jgi:hypothetical protein